MRQAWWSALPRGTNKSFNKLGLNSQPVAWQTSYLYYKPSQLLVCIMGDIQRSYLNLAPELPAIEYRWSHFTPWLYIKNTHNSSTYFNIADLYRVNSWPEPVVSAHIRTQTRRHRLSLSKIICWQRQSSWKMATNEASEKVLICKSGFCMDIIYTMIAKIGTAGQMCIWCIACVMGICNSGHLGKWPPKKLLRNLKVLNSDYAY